MSASSQPWEVERDRFGVMFSGSLQVGECRRVVDISDPAALIDRGLRATYGDRHVDSWDQDWRVEKEHEMRTILAAALGIAYGELDPPMNPKLRGAGDSRHG